MPITACRADPHVLSDLYENNVCVSPHVNSLHLGEGKKSRKKKDAKTKKKRRQKILAFSHRRNVRDVVWELT
jgi:hypothetical protein